MEKTFSTRKFLNSKEHGGTAFIEAYVDPSDTCINSEFKIGDCNRIVELQFGVYGDEESANVRQKVRAFRRAVVQFEIALLAQLDAFDARPKE